MKKIESAGIVISRRLDTLPTQVLLGHSTHKNPLSFEDNRWTLLKGKVESDENIWQAAKREFSEESGFNIKEEKFLSVSKDNKGNPIPWMQYSLATKEGGKDVTKLVHVFWIIDILNLTRDFPFKCQTNLKNTEFPEIDGYTWVTPHAATKMCMPSQRFIFENLHEIISSLR